MAGITNNEMPKRTNLPGPEAHATPARECRFALRVASGNCDRDTVDIIYIQASASASRDHTESYDYSNRRHGDPLQHTREARSVLTVDDNRRSSRYPGCTVEYDVPNLYCPVSASTKMMKYFKVDRGPGVGAVLVTSAPPCRGAFSPAVAIETAQQKHETDVSPRSFVLCTRLVPMIR